MQAPIIGQKIRLRLRRIAKNKKIAEKLSVNRNGIIISFIFNYQTTFNAYIFITDEHKSQLIIKLKLSL